MVFDKDGNVTATLAAQFDKYMKNYTGLYHELAETTAGFVPAVSREPLVVDLGVGPGLFSVRFHHRVPAAWLYGVDPSRLMLSLAERNTREAVVLRFVPVQGRAEHLPFKSGCVDVVVCRFSLLYWQRPRDGCSEMFRVLRPGGRVVVESLNRRFSRWRRWVMYRGMRLHGAEKRVVLYQKDAFRRAFTLDDIEKFLVDAGFHILKKEGARKDWRFLIVAEK